jgi:hypothetical protein
MAPRPDDRGARGVLTVVALIVAALPARVWPSSPEGQVDRDVTGVAQVDPTGPAGGCGERSPGRCPQRDRERERQRRRAPGALT